MTEKMRSLVSTVGTITAFAATALVLYGMFIASRPSAAVEAQVEPLLAQLVPADFVEFSFQPSIADGRQRCYARIDASEAARRHIQTLRGTAQLAAYVTLPAGESPIYLDAEQEPDGWRLSAALFRPGQVSTADLRARVQACLPAFRAY
jgi:hypothetical protein